MDLNSRYSIEVMQMGGKDIKSGSVLLAIRETKIKILMRCHFTRMAVIKKTAKC